jgi:hypothetical protein
MKRTIDTQMRSLRKKGKNIKRNSSTENQKDPALIGNLLAKRKVTSPLEEKRITQRKKSRPGECTYAEACISSDGIRENNHNGRSHKTDKK